MADLSVYELLDRLFILQASLTTDGGLRRATPGFGRPLNVSHEELGGLVLSLVVRVLPVVPHSISGEERRQLQGTILRESGYRTWLSLDKYAKLCSVSGSAQRLEITPFAGRRFEDRKKGFQAILERTMLLETPQPEVVGRSIRQALEVASRLP
jgi:hypothetical protein